MLFFPEGHVAANIGISYYSMWFSQLSLFFLDKLFGTNFTINTISGPAKVPYGYFYLLYFLAVLIPSLAVAVRRLHDIGKSGWFFLICLIPIVGSIWLLVLMCIDSIPGPNQYGINPKGIGNYDEIDQVGSYLQK